LVASLSSACLFPSLDLTGGDASGDATSFDAPNETGVDASSSDAATDGGGFHAGIGCGAATSDLLAYYTLDEGSGTVVHDCVSSPANDGNILDPTHTSWVTGQHGKALEIDPFTGVCVTIDFATPTFAFGGTNAKAFTVAMWIYVIALPVGGENGYIAGLSSNITMAGWRFSVVPSGTINFAVPDGNGNIVVVMGPTIATGAWHHVAAVYGGGAANSFVYLDAKPGSAQVLPATWAADGTSDHMRVGCSADDQHQLDARVDEIRFYDRALSGAEIAIVKNAQ
jgi:hypothetical protein